MISINSTLTALLLASVWHERRFWERKALACKRLERLTRACAYLRRRLVRLYGVQP